MATLDEDILEVLAEVGVPYTVHKPDGTTVTGEYFDDTPHTEHTTPIIRGFFHDFTLHHPSQANVGDVLEYLGGSKLLLVAKAPESFEGGIIDYLASGYVVNSLGTLQNYDASAGYDASYRKVKAWIDTYTGVQATMMDRQFRSAMKAIADESMEVELDRIHLWLSDYYDVEPGMRWKLSDTEYYKVEQIEPYRFPGLKLVFLTEDTRG